MMQLDEAWCVRVKEEMQQIRRRKGWKSVLVMLLCIPVLAAGIALMVHVKAAGHPRLGNFLLSIGVIGAFVPLILGGVMRSRMESELIGLMQEPLKAIRRHYITPFEQPQPMPVDDMFARCIARMHKRLIWCEQGYYKGVSFAVSKVHFWYGSGDNKEQYNRIVLTLPIRECAVQLCHTRCFDLLKGKATWTGAYGSMSREEKLAAGEAFRQVVTDEWSAMLNCKAIESRIWRDMQVADIALDDRPMLRHRGRVDDPRAYLQWYSEQLQQMCVLLEAAMKLELFDKENKGI